MLKKVVGNCLLLSFALESSAMEAAFLPFETESNSQSIINIHINKPRSKDICVATKIDGYKRNIYLTTAHCLEGAISIENGEGLKANQYFLHPLYAFDPRADIAAFEMPNSDKNPSYYLYQGFPANLTNKTLLAVGKRNNGVSVQTVLVDNAIINGSVIRKEGDNLSSVLVSGQSGSPLLIQDEDGSYQVVGVAARSINGKNIQLTGGEWSLIDSQFIGLLQSTFSSSQDLFSQSFNEGKLQDSTPQVRSLYLKSLNTTWENLQEDLHNKPDVQYYLGLAALFGWKERNDREAALQYFTDAAHRGYAPSQKALAFMENYQEPFEEGHGLVFLRRPAEGSQAYVLRIIKTSFVIISGVGAAIVYYVDPFLLATKMKAYLGDTEAQDALGEKAYKDGDLEKAAKFYTRFNSKSKSKIWLGSKSNPTESLEECRKAAKEGNVGAQYRLGLRFLKGVGVKKNIIEARKYLQAATDQDYAPAQFILGWTYERENKGNNNSIVRELYEKAANQGHSEAQYRLGVLLALDNSDNQAFKWWLRAAAQDNFEAHFSLGNFYLRKSYANPLLKLKASDHYAIAANKGELKKAFYKLKEMVESGVSSEQAKATYQERMNFTFYQDNDKNNEVNTENNQYRLDEADL